MRGRSRSFEGAVHAVLVSAVIVSVAPVAGCSPSSLQPVETDGGGGALPPTPLAPRLLASAAVDAVALAADGSGIYWTTPANELWVLPTASAVPARLAGDPGPVAAPCPRPTPLLLSPLDAFWMAADRATIHRTRKDGTTDERLATVAGANNLTTSGGALYWTESARGYVDGYTEGSVIRSLRSDAAPGSPATTLLLSFDAISSLAVADGVAYWTPYPNATVYHADIWTAPVAALARGELGTKLPGPPSPYALTGAGLEVLFGFYRDRFTTELARLQANGAPQIVGTLPRDDGFLGELAATDGWLLATTYPSEYGCGQPPLLHLYAAPMAGGTPRLVAQGLRTPAIAAPHGIVFVDADSHLVALPTSDLAPTTTPER